jgi:hypothetical protein
MSTFQKYDTKSLLYSLVNVYTQLHYESIFLNKMNISYKYCRNCVNGKNIVECIMNQVAVDSLTTVD